MDANDDQKKSCKKPNEQYAECGVNACNNLTCKKQTPSACTKICDRSAAGCVCVENYFRDNKGNCVPASKCTKKNTAWTVMIFWSNFFSIFAIVNFTGPKTECKKSNETFAECGVNACNNRSCEDREKEVACIDLCQPQNAGCACQQNYFRNPNGDCVPASQCTVSFKIIFFFNHHVKFWYFSILLHFHQVHPYAISRMKHSLHVVQVLAIIQHAHNLKWVKYAQRFVNNAAIVSANRNIIVTNAPENAFHLWKNAQKVQHKTHSKHQTVTNITDHRWWCCYVLNSDLCC